MKKSVAVRKKKYEIKQTEQKKSLKVRKVSSTKKQKKKQNANKFLIQKIMILLV